MEIIDLDKTIETTIFEGTLEDMEDKIVEENIGIIGAMIIIEAGIGQEKEHSQGHYGNNRDLGVPVTSRFLLFKVKESISRELVLILA